MQDPASATGQDNTATVPNAEAAPQAKAPVTPAPAPAATPAPEQAPPAKPAEAAPAPKEPASLLGGSEQADKPAEPGAESDPGAAGPEFEAKFPDGVHVDQEAMAAVKEAVKAGDIKPEMAQKLLDQHLAAVNRYEEAKLAEGFKTIEGWQNEIRSHPEFGGARLGENLEAANLMLQKYGTPRLVKEFKRMGVIDHPDFAFMLMRMSRDVSEGKSLGGANQATPEASAEAIYPTMAGKK